MVFSLFAQMISVQRIEGNKGSRRNSLLLSRSEHLLQQIENRPGSGVVHPPQFSNQPSPVYGPDLVEDNLARLSLEAAGHPGWIGTTFGAHRGHDHRSKILVHLIGGNNETGTSLLNLASNSRI